MSYRTAVFKKATSENIISVLINQGIHKTTHI